MRIIRSRISLLRTHTDRGSGRQVKGLSLHVTENGRYDLWDIIRVDHIPENEETRGWAGLVIWLCLLSFPGTSSFCSPSSLHSDSSPAPRSWRTLGEPKPKHPLITRIAQGSSAGNMPRLFWPLMRFRGLRTGTPRDAPRTMGYTGKRKEGKREVGRHREKMGSRMQEG